jgi:hypothetical protein
MIAEKKKEMKSPDYVDEGDVLALLLNDERF